MIFLRQRKSPAHGASETRLPRGVFWYCSTAAKILPGVRDPGVVFFVSHFSWVYSGFPVDLRCLLDGGQYNHLFGIVPFTLNPLY